MSHPALEGSERWKADRDQETGVFTELPVKLCASAGRRVGRPDDGRSRLARPVRRDRAACARCV